MVHENEFRNAARDSCIRVPRAFGPGSFLDIAHLEEQIYLRDKT